jgi:hypothetical protein
MKGKIDSMFQTGGTGIGVLNFQSLGFFWLRIVSDFELRISDFDSRLALHLKDQ